MKKLLAITQHTDLAWPWPNNNNVTNELLKDQLKLYRQLLNNPGFLKNLGGNGDSPVKQYKHAVEPWIKKQTADEGGPAGGTPAPNPSI